MPKRLPAANDRERMVGVSTPIVAVDTHTVRVLLMGLDGEAALAVIEAERKAHRGEDGYVLLAFPAKATRVLPG